MFDTFSIEQFVDIGFILLVSGACLRSLFHNTEAQEQRIKLWKSELGQTTELLRELVTEASSASMNLDRSLGRRKDELEKLLHKIESVGTIVLEKITQAEDDDLPNDSWRKPLDFKKLNKSTSTNRTGLSDLVDSQDDRISLSIKASERLDQAAAERVQQKSNLSKQVRVTRAEAPELEFEPRNSVIDPVAYKVARRLLTRGQEIHVVARKLELPLSEVRLLDKVIRQEQERHKSQAQHRAETNSAPRSRSDRELLEKFVIDDSDDFTNDSIIP